MKLRRFSFLLSAGLCLTAGSSLFAASTWSTVGGGDWSTASNWTGDGIPNAVSAVADFSTVTPTGTAAVTLSAPVTSGTLKFGSNATWDVTGSTANLLTLSNGATAASVQVGSGSTVTFSNLASAGEVAISGGGTVTVTNGSGVKSWSVTNATLLNSTSLGTGTVTLNDGAVLASRGSSRRTLSNQLIINGECTLDSVGWNFNGTMSGSGLIHKTGGWQINMNQSNPDLSADWSIENDFVQCFKANGLGTGKVTIKGTTQAVGVLLAYNNATLANAIEVQSNINFLVGGGLGNTATLTGNLTGTGSILMRSNQYPITGTTNLQGDATGFSGTWYLHQTYINNSKVLSAPFTVTTNNTNSAKVDGADSRFGSGTIHFGRAVLSPFAGTNAFIHNNIAFDQNTASGVLDGKTAVISLPASSSLTLTGQLSGTSPVTVTGNGSDSELVLNCTNSNLTSAWNTSNVKITLSNANSKSAAPLGSGLLTVNETTIGTAGSGDLRIENPIQLDGTLFTALARPLYLNGNLTGSGNIVMKSGGYTFGIRGDNRNFTGNISIANDYVNTDNTNSAVYENGADLRFGQGSLYFNGTGVSGVNDQKIYVANDIYVLSGQTGSFWKGNFQLRGVLTANGALSSRTSGTDYATLTIENKLQGNATIALPTTIAADGVLAPGSVGVVNFDGTSATDVPIGKLTFSKGLTLESGSILSFDVASKTSYDQVVLSGTANELNLDGVTVDLNFMEGFDANDLTPGTTFNLLSGAEITGSEGLKLNYDRDFISKAYVGAILEFSQTGGQMQVQAAYDRNMVPEPASWLLLVLGVGLGVCRFRRR